jgi:ADP-dependent NAD(P)H-hydrate dehydratase / NAD(P)H-hydrate epimerase
MAPDPELRSLDAAWVAERLPDRPVHANKGTFGRVLVAGGSLEYGGALLLAGLGAARAGAGLVCLAGAESVTLRLMGQVPELTALPLAEEAHGLVAPAGWRQLARASTEYDALVFGPGLGRQPNTLRRARAWLGEVKQPCVVDADALNALALGNRWWAALQSRLVLTPHPVEFGRLTGASGPAADDDAARASAAAGAAALWGQVVVLKGARTVIAGPDGSLLRSEVMTPALATAGTGDVLAGVIAALLAAGLQPVEAAACGVAVHARAGEIAERRVGRAGAMARDVANLVPEAITELSAADR